MLNKIIYIIFSIFITHNITGCGGGGSSSSEVSDTSSADNAIIQDDVTKANKKYYGLWIYPETGKSVYITSQTDFTYKEIDENILQDSKNKYLVRAGLEKTQAKGQVYVPTEDLSKYTSRASGGSKYAGVGGLKVVLQNMKDKKIQEEKQTESNGQFVGENLPAGEYKLTIGDDDSAIEKTITLTNQEENLGNFVLLDPGTNNFKADLIMTERFNYADNTIHKGKVRVSNISDVDSLGLVFELSVTDDHVSYFNYDIKTGSVLKGRYVDIPFEISVKDIEDFEYKLPIKINIKDINYNEWFEESVVTFYREKMKIYVATEESSVKGYITLPNNEQLNIILSKGYIELPKLKDHDYYVVLANSSLSGETAYTIGYEKSVVKPKDFIDTGRYESTNGTFAGAKEIKNREEITAYVHIGDLDLYKIIADDLRTIKNAEKSTLYFSNELVVSNNNILASIDNGSLYVNGQLQSDKNVIVNAGDKIKIQLQSSGQLGAVVSSVLSIGDKQEEFIVMTKKEDYPFLANGKYTAAGTSYYYLNMPNTGKLDISTDSALYTIYDLDFNVIKSRSSLSKTLDLPAGDYIIKVENNTKDRYINFYSPILGQSSGFLGLENQSYNDIGWSIYSLKIDSPSQLSVVTKLTPQYLILDRNLNIVHPESNVTQDLSLEPGEYLVKFLINSYSESISFSLSGNNP